MNAQAAAAYDYDVFLSHNGQDKPWVRSLVEQFRGIGLKVFFDEDTILGGEPVVRAIENGLLRSRHVLLVLSRAALASRWVALETAITIAEDPDGRGRRVIPVKIEELDLNELRPALRS